MTEFTPVSASLGGALIGAAAVLLMALNGRIAGISGIASGMMVSPVDDRLWRILFVIGLVSAPLMWSLTGQSIAFELSAGAPTIIIAGFLVGFSTRLGSGCTSGHGVCGVSRVSARSIASTLVFMGTGIATVFLMNLTAG
ncbi:MAG: YeeE/YedE family protein [Pseudomonadota bacterium]